MKAHLAQINLSQGGVPKRAVQTARIAFLGLEGDQQAHDQVHGGPERAVCLYSLERILALQAEGHPVFPGALGENLTLWGLDWSPVTPGVRLHIGDQVTLEVTRYTTPCKTIQAYFREQHILRIHQEQFPGWSRVYARVLTPGEVCAGMPVSME
ncbi:MAG: MOSC domain-containing protein [Anaerolineales bacterium]